MRQETPPFPRNRRPRVLLADDHTMLLDACRRLLEPRCEIVGTAGDGRAILDLAFRTGPDVIVLDISMPRLNGVDACAQLRQKVPESRPPQLPVLTNYFA